MKKLIVASFTAAALFALISTASAQVFTVVTESSVDASGGAEVDGSGVPVDVPASIAHVYMLRTTYSIYDQEADADVRFIPAGCGSMVGCWNDTWDGTLDLQNPKNNVRWALIDQSNGQVIASRSEEIRLKPLALTIDATKKLDFSGALDQLRVSSYPVFSDESDHEFALPDGRHSIFFSALFLDDLYDGGKIVVRHAEGGENRYLLAGIEYGGQTAAGDVVPVRPGAEFPNEGVWLSDGKNEGLFNKVGPIRVVQVENRQ